ncbi:MAG TPA: VOC family protein [Terracidiphilus sp.]|nr:VOC family protein [Terracidiphilus sp.]
MDLNTYLNYGGNTEEAFRFYERHLGAKILYLSRHGDVPGQGNVPPELKGKVLHARISLGGQQVAASDVPPERFKPMRSAYLSLVLDSPEEAERVYALLADGGEVFMPIAETFFATRFAQLRDRFGTLWMILNEKL